MSESSIHHEYVEKIYDKAKNMIDKSQLYYLKADLFDHEKPCLVYGSYIPDVMYCNNGTLIIGEAKTFNDFNTEHSYKQYESYMMEIKNYPGDTYLIICIPWMLFISAKNHFKLLKERFNVNTKIIIITDNNWEGIV